jgi:hypothetical protein
MRVGGLRNGRAMKNTEDAENAELRMKYETFPRSSVSSLLVSGRAYPEIQELK